MRLVWILLPDAVNGKLCDSTPLVNVTMECLDSDNSKNDEEKEHKYQSIGQLRERPQHDCDQSSHAWQPLDRSKRSYNPECP